MNDNDFTLRYESVIQFLEFRGVPANLENLGGSCWVLMIQRRGWYITVASTTSDGLELDFSASWDWDVARFRAYDHTEAVSHKVIKRESSLDGLLQYIRSEMERLPQR